MKSHCLIGETRAALTSTVQGIARSPAWRRVEKALGIALALGLTQNAYAANRTVCFEINILDDRHSCTESGDPGHQRPCDPTGGEAEVSGFRYELWDKDGTVGADDLIGPYWMSGTGVRCATFPWEGASYQTGDSEAQPDVYIVLIPKTSGTSTSNMVVARDGAGVNDDDVSWRDGDGVDPNAFVAVDCTTAGSCYIDGGTPLIPTTVVTSRESRAFMALDTIQRTLEEFDGGMNPNGLIEMLIDTQTNLPCNCEAETSNRNRIQITTTRAGNGLPPAHEMGHVLQEREFGQDTLIDVYAGPEWGIATTETNSAATTEGWASYVALVTWWDASNTSSAPVYGDEEWDMQSADVINGLDCATQAPDVPGQVTKAFWDMDDADPGGVETSTDGSGDDTNNLAHNFLLDQWDDFANNASNRGDEEADDDGVNMWDYRYNAPIGDEDTLLNHNCLSAQDTN